MRRPLVLLTAAALVGATALSGPSQALDSKDSAKPKIVRTHYAFNASGYGSQVKGGDLPVNSDQTAFDLISCTNKAGIVKSNYVAKSKLLGLGTLHGVRTKVWTTHKGAVDSSYSMHSIARIVLGQSSLGSLEIRGLESLSRAYHTPSGFHASTKTSVAKLTFTPTGGKAVSLTLPEPGAPITVPGLARISLGNVIKNVDKQGASASADVLRISVIPLGTRAVVGQSRATIGGTVRKGLFKGYAAGVRATALDDNLKVGRTPLVVSPCTGTHGKKDVESVASADTGDLLTASGVGVGQVSQDKGGKATGTERSVLASASLGGGAIEITGVAAQATVTRTKDKLTRSSAGTKVGTLTVNGTDYNLKKLPTINIPGIAKIQSGLKKKLPNGLRVIALRVTLLDGTGAVVDLGVAELQIKKSKL